jgi:outer membrane protein assembly factor BamA
MEDSARAAQARDTSDGSLGPFVLPGIFYTPETGLGGGIGALWVKGHRDHVTRPSTYSMNAIATRNGQFTLGLSADAWTPKNEWHLTFDGLLSKYPYRFYGIGAAGIDSGEKYTPTTRMVTVTAQRALRPGIYGGFRLSYDDVDVTDVDPGALLNGAQGATGWKLVSLGVMANRDTRDRYYWPSRGTFASVSASRALGRLGSTHPFSRLTLDARHYLTITGEHVLALQGWADVTDGIVPFDRLPQLGGQAIARGFMIGRFRDQQAAAVQAEYRSAPFRVIEDVKRLTVVAFTSLATTAPVIGQFAGDRTHFTGGVGLRYALSLPDRYNLRLDYGRGRGVGAFSITVGEAF